MADCVRLWEQFVRLSNDIETIRVSFLNECQEEISGTIHKAFRSPVHRGAAFQLIHWIPREKRTEFLGELMEFACYANKYTEVARAGILELPRSWTIENIRAAYEPIVQRESAHEEEFGLVLSVLSELDHTLAADLAMRATKHQYPEVQKLGTDYLRRNNNRV